MYVCQSVSAKWGKREREGEKHLTKRTNEKLDMQRKSIKEIDVEKKERKGEQGVLLVISRAK